MGLGFLASRPVIIMKRMQMESKNNISGSEQPIIDASLIVEYLKGHTSREEDLLVGAWMTEKEENRAEIRKVAEIYYTKRAHDRMASRDVELAYRKVISHVGRVRTSRRNMWWISVAAAVVGAVLLSSIYVLLARFDSLGNEAASVIVEANPGVRTCVNLPDGTVVNLNSGSKIIYPENFQGKYRSVTVEGEVFFQVKRNEAKPFIVKTSDGKASVQVLGTSFNIQSFRGEREFTAALITGSVLVSLNCVNGKTISKRLVPLEKLIFNENTDCVSVETVDADAEIAWTKGIHVFKNTPMSQVLKTLSHSYNVEFAIHDPSIASYRFTGTFNNRQLVQILDYIKISSNIDYEINTFFSDDSIKVERTKIILK